MAGPRTTIRTGIGGWTYAPWRGPFYPAGLRQADEVQYATAHLGTIEINGTFYRLQKPETFATWREAAPGNFVFAVKGSRFITNRKVLAEAGEGIAKFFAQGIEELGDKLGPILWQFAPTKAFDPEDFAAFLRLLPSKCAGLPLRHALEVRHESFACPEFVALAREHGTAIVIADHAQYPQIADLTADFVYARLMRTEETLATGYSAEALEQWAHIAQVWSGGQTPEGLEYASAEEESPAGPRNVFVYMISGAKVRAPAAAMALAELLRG